MLGIVEELKEYIQTRNNKIRHLSYFAGLKIHDVEVINFPTLTHAPYKCECGEYYAVDITSITILKRSDALKCLECGEEVGLIILPTRSNGVLLKGLNDQDPDLDMRSVYKNREDVEKHGKIQKWHDNF